MKKVKDYNLPYTLDPKDSENREKVRETFIKNMDHSEELRKDMWLKIYAKKFLRKDLKAIDECEEEWAKMTHKDKIKWFDYQCAKDLSFIQELLYIANLLKIYKGNVIKVTRETRKYFKKKKLDKNKLLEEDGEEEEEEEDNETEDKNDEDYKYDDTDDYKEYPEFSEVPSNTLHLAALAAKDSNTLKNFKELPKEVKHSFYKDADIKEVRHRLKNYKEYMYIRKTLKLQEQENKNIIQNKNQLYYIKNKEDLKSYFESINELHLYYSLERNNCINQVVIYIQSLDKNGINEDIINSNTEISNIWEDYEESNSSPPYIDDVGNLGMVMDISVTSSGRSGNERLAGITAISATRDIDIKQSNEKKTQHNMFSKIISKFK